MNLSSIRENEKNEIEKIEEFEKFDVLTTPTSSFSIMLGKRRSGKSVLAEYFINELIDNKQIDICYLLSGTMAGFDSIDAKNKFDKIENLINLLENMKKINKLNKVVNKKEKVKLKIMVVIDDMAIHLKSKEFNILEEIAVNGRHYAYEPLSLHFIILCVIDDSIRGKRQARDIYSKIVLTEDFQFMVIENYKQNVKTYTDYIKTYKAII